MSGRLTTPHPHPAATRLSALRSSATRIVSLAWPVFVGQIAVLAFATVDTVLAARYGARDLAALAIGGAVYISIFIGLMGVILAVGPIAGQLLGAGRPVEAGRQFRQAVWLALGLSVIGCIALLFPEPFLRLSQAAPDVEVKVRAYLAALALALPFSLCFAAFRAFSTAVSRPKAVMVLQLGALGVKVPLTALLVFGASFDTPFGSLRVPDLGAAGCGLATAIVMVCQLLAAVGMLQYDPFYRRFELRGRWPAPHRASLAGLLRLGLPMGLSTAVEVTGFTFMAFFISRLGATPVAGHQIAVNLVSLMFMMPLSIANASCTLVALRIGAGDAGDARRLGWHGLQFGVAIAALTGLAVFLLRSSILGIYTHDPVIIAAALPLLAWVVVFHIADAAQTIATFVLRAYRIATVPVLIYVVAIWGIGIGGGYSVAFDVGGWTPAPLHGARGFWAASTLGLVVAACAMSGFLLAILRREKARQPMPTVIPAGP